MTTAASILHPERLWEILILYGFAKIQSVTAQISNTVRGSINTEFDITQKVLPSSFERFDGGSYNPLAELAKAEIPLADVIFAMSRPCVT